MPSAFLLYLYLILSEQLCASSVPLCPSSPPVTAIVTTFWYTYVQL